MNLLALDMQKKQGEMKITILYRQGGEWHPIEVSRLVSGLNTPCCEHPRHKEYLLLSGHYTKEKTLEVLLGGVAYTASQVTGLRNPQLPFTPVFI